MRRSMILILGALIACLVVPAFASASIAFTRISAPYTFSSQPLNPAIYTAKNDGTGVRKLSVTGQQPEISPDGTMVAYLVSSTPSYSSTLHFVTIATGVDTNTKIECENATWAPNSSAVACNTTSKSFSGLITVTPAGKSTVIAKNTSSVGVGWNSTTWSPDSSMIAWESDTSTSTDMGGVTRKLRALKADGTGSIVKLGNGGFPVWGPDRIAFTRFTGSGDMAVEQIWTVNPATQNDSTAKQLTHWTRPTNSMDSGPAPSMWTPNGKTIIGAVNGMDDTAVTIGVNATSGKITTIGWVNSYANRPMAVSTDGANVLVHNYSQASGTNKDYGTINLVSINGKTSSLFLNHVSYLSASADWTP
jgi:WD40-like Beta Propeller Repeat